MRLGLFTVVLAGFGTDDGVVKRVAMTGGPPSVIAPAQNGPYAIANDATGVYWTTLGDGAVRVIRKK